MIPEGLSEVLNRIAQIQASLGQAAACAPPPSGAKASFDAVLRDASSKAGLDPALVKAVVSAESGGDPTATSSVGAMGLMQLMPETARDMGVPDPYDPAQNLAGGTRYLRRMLDQFGNVPEALAAYNAGPGAVERHGGIPPFKETQHYVNHVLDLYRQQQEGSR